MSTTFARLAPVGQPLVLGPAGPLPAPPPGYRLIGTQSGTAALALALLLARLRRPEVRLPEVLLPGYACPDLLAAAHWAGVRPLLVDLAANDTRLCDVDLRRRASAGTVAIVAVNFLGIADDLATLRAEACELDAFLIEDDAQWCPEPFTSANLVGDAVVLSFGRGKPVPLVGGGALLLHEAHAAALPELTPAHDSPLRARLGMRAYNLTLTPLVYGALSRLPIGVGRTRYHALEDVRALDALRSARVAANIAHQQAQPRSVEQGIRDTVLPNAPAGTLDLPTRAGGRAGRLLRYPLLLPDEATRDRVRAALADAGCGPSAMYERVLPEVDGVSADTDAPALPNARDFARRLLTLPVHGHVNARHLRAMAAAFSATE